MDAIELLAREDEFKRLNKQLEKKTESLMKEIEQVMQKQDFFAAFSPSLSPSHTKIKKHCYTPEPSPIRIPRKNSLRKPHTPTSDSNSEFENRTQNYKTKSSTQNGYKTKNNIQNGDIAQNVQNNETCTHNRVICDCCPIERNSNSMEFLQAFVAVNVKDKVLPPSFSKDRISVESVCKFLSSKINLMQEQIDKLQNVVDRKASQCEGHLTQLAEFESERLNLLNRTNNMKASTADMRAKYMALQKRLEEKDKQYKETRSESDKLSAELKRVINRCTTVEARCSTQDQLIDSLRQQAEAAKRAEKEFRDSTRSLSSSHQSAISRLESQTKSLSTRLAKQAALIDNLRKQNLLLATDGAVKCLERDYCNFLNQDF